MRVEIEEDREDNDFSDMPELIDQLPSPSSAQHSFQYAQHSHDDSFEEDFNRLWDVWRGRRPGSTDPNSPWIGVIMDDMSPPPQEPSVIMDDMSPPPQEPSLALQVSSCAPLVEILLLLA